MTEERIDFKSAKAKSKDLKFCLHCNQYLNRKTVRLHSKQQQQGKSRRNLYDIKRLIRSKDSSDEEDFEDELDITDQVTNRQNTCDVPEKDEDEESLESSPESRSESSSEDDEGIQHWDDESEEDIEMDIREGELRETSQGTNGFAWKTMNWIICSITFLQCAYCLSDKVVEKVLLLFSQVFTVLSSVNSLCKDIAKIFPLSVYMLRKWTQFDRDDFLKYIVCPNCVAIYKYTDIVFDRNGITHVKKCTNKVFGCRVDKSSNDKGKRGKYKCNANLVREVKLTNNKSKYYPLKVYCVQSIINSLEKLLSRPGFEEECNKWRQRPETESYGDVYDGEIWKQFQNYHGEAFLSEPNSYGLMINVDWFQPFKHRNDYSVGAIYAIFMNLPRSLRFAPENMLLLGIIPALKKEPGNLDSFLKPIIDELKILSKGITVSPLGKEPVTVRALLLCSSCDIPAARKLSGFMGHSAIQGCSFCVMPFLDDEQKRYCGPVHPKWKNRNREQHLKAIHRQTKETTITGQKQISKETGYKSTALLELDYFEPSKFSVVEPMHNLFLGTAKKCFTHWVDSELLTRKNLEEIGERINKLTVSSDIGRLPSNIASNFSQFTANEWKNGTLIYSLYCLQGILSDESLRVWQKFVLACRHLCQPTIPKNRLVLSHRLFLMFSNECERLYGREFLTPNIHLHGHLKESVENYGSIYGFWAFSFERYNGMLADFPTNKRSVELQIMRKFQQIGFSADLKFRNFGNDFNEQFQQFVGHTPNAEETSVKVLDAPHIPLTEVDQSVWSDLSALKVKHEGYKLVKLNKEQLNMLLQTLSIMYTENINLTDVAVIAKQFSSVYWKNELYGSSSRCRGQSLKMVLAKWAADDSSIDINFPSNRPGKIRHFLQHTATIHGKTLEHLFAVVEWHKSTEEKLGYLPPVSVWSAKQLNDGPGTFIPVQRLSSKCAWATQRKGQQTYVVVSPATPHIFT